jgi:hypothetical protein
MVDISNHGVLAGVALASFTFVCCCLPCIILMCCYYCLPRRFFKLATWRAARQAKVTVCTLHTRTTRNENKHRRSFVC